MERWRRDNALYNFIKQYDFNRYHVKYTYYDYRSNIFTYYVIDDNKLLIIKSLEIDDTLTFEVYEPTLNLIDTKKYDDLKFEYRPIIHTVYNTLWISPSNDLTRKETSELSKVPSNLNSNRPYECYENTQIYSMDKYKRICIDIQESTSIERITNKVTKLKNDNDYTYDVYKLLHDNKFNKVKNDL